MSEEIPVSEWSKIPVPLQHQFFEHAQREAEALKKKMLKQQEKLKKLSKHLTFKPIPDHEWQNWKVAAVDGSFPPLTERLGARIGVYSAGYMIFKGRELLPREKGGEKYKSGIYSTPQFGDSWKSRKIISLLTTKLEREIALYCLENQDVDYVLIDGSFFGFQPRCSEIRDEEINTAGYKYGSELVDDVRDLSAKLLRSKKAAGIIKRVRTIALDGFLLLEYGSEEECIGANDKIILAGLMPEKTWFAYQSLFDSPGEFRFYSSLRGVLRMYETTRAKAEDLQAILEMTRNVVAKRVQSNLDCDMSLLLEGARYYVLCLREAPPFCLEVHRDTEVEPLLAYLQAFHNAATGLPYPIDLMDENITLPSDFTKEFVSEVEARLIRDPESRGIYAANYLRSINPQKEE